MSQKKATPKAVFAACQQLAASSEEGESWNRDDVRFLVGGGSFAVIDPLIKTWRELQPIREIAPSLPTELLMQVASLLEQQIEGYISEVQQRDEQRGALFDQTSIELAENFRQMEEHLTSELEEAKLSNHVLESECSRLQSELITSQQENSSQSLKLEMMEKELDQAGLLLQSEKKRHDGILQRSQREAEAFQTRMAEQNTQAMNHLKLDYQQQLANQKIQLADAAELSENRLMRLLDQSRLERKESQTTFEIKLSEYHQKSQQDQSIIGQHKLQVSVLQAEVKQQSEQLSQLIKENKDLKDQLSQQHSEITHEDASDLKAIKDSIAIMQKQLSNP